MEYMVCKSPIVSFKLLENKFSAKNSALYVKDNSVTEFANGILFLLNNVDLAEEMTSFGYKRVHSKLSWEKQEKNLLAAYNCLTSGI